MDLIPTVAELTGGKKLSDVDHVPAYWPDNETVRNDMLDYAVMESSPSTLRSEPMPLPASRAALSVCMNST